MNIKIIILCLLSNLFYHFHIWWFLFNLNYLFESNLLNNLFCISLKLFLFFNLWEWESVMPLATLCICDSVCASSDFLIASGLSTWCYKNTMNWGFTEKNLVYFLRCIAKMTCGINFTKFNFACLLLLWLYNNSCLHFIFFQKITVAECIETQSKAMTMLTIDQLSYLLKFALQKIKQPGVRKPFYLLYCIVHRLLK